MSVFKKKPLLIFLSVSLLIAVVGFTTGIYLYTKKHKDLSKVKADYILNAQDFIAEFEKYETGALSKYLNKVVEVSGIVTNLEYSSVNKTLNLTFSDEGKMTGVICTFNGVTDQSNIQATINNRHIIRGECSGILMDILLNDCVLVK